MKYLIIKPSSLGDVLHAFPAVRNLTEAHPGSKVDWLIHPAFAPLLKYHPSVDKAIPFERKLLGNPKTFPKAILQLRKELRKEHYEAVIDLQGLMRSAMIGALATGHHCGPAEVKEFPATFFYTQKLRVKPGLDHALERNCALIADYLKADIGSTEFDVPVLREARDSASRLFAGSTVEFMETAGGPHPVVSIAPGARWKTKQWPPEFFAAAMTEMWKRRPELRFVLVGSKTESKSGAEIRAKLPDALPVLDLCGKTSLPELMEILRSAAVFLCNDSGPMHMAAMLGTPVAALFGPTSPRLTGPYCSQKRVFQPDLVCKECFRRYCEKMECHKSIEPEAAAEAALKIMKG